MPTRRTKRKQAPKATEPEENASTTQSAKRAKISKAETKEEPKETKEEPKETKEPQTEKKIEPRKRKTVVTKRKKAYSIKFYLSDTLLPLETRYTKRSC
jgi:hypothetical protein